MFYILHLTICVGQAKRHIFIYLLESLGQMEHLKRRKPFRHLISAPFIYAVFIPLVLLDIILEIYHRICFPLYELPYVKRKKYIKIIDRYKLRYLTCLQKINCMYCGYANGLLHYAAEIVVRSEKYWCGIAHQKTKGFVEPKHHKEFVKYGDEKEFRKRFE